MTSKTCSIVVQNFNNTIVLQKSLLESLARVLVLVGIASRRGGSTVSVWRLSLGVRTGYLAEKAKKTRHTKANKVKKLSAG
jgi:hypothetical protein